MKGIKFDGRMFVVTALAVPLVAVHEEPEMLHIHQPEAPAPKLRPVTMVASSTSLGAAVASPFFALKWPDLRSR